MWKTNISQDTSIVGDFFEVGEDNSTESCLEDRQDQSPTGDRQESEANTNPSNSVTGHLSILPINHKLEDLISRKHTRTSCPLCLPENYGPAFPSTLQKHITRFHNEKCFVHAGMKHFCCRLGCKSSMHYHTLCGMLYREAERALSHVKICKGACKFGHYLGVEPYASEYVLVLVKKTKSPKKRDTAPEKAVPQLSTVSLDHGSYSSTTFNPEDTGHISITPVNFDLENLVYTSSGPCPLCLERYFVENFPSVVKRHIRRFHSNRYFIAGGLKFYICRLGCMSGGHYHCVCGNIFKYMARAMDHVAKCDKHKKFDAINRKSNEENTNSSSVNTQNQDSSREDDISALFDDNLPHRYLEFYICRLDCASEGHYHCLCGMTFRHKKRAKNHVTKCYQYLSEPNVEKGDNPNSITRQRPEVETVASPYHEMADTSTESVEESVPEHTGHISIAPVNFDLETSAWTSMKTKVAKRGIASSEGLESNMISVESSEGEMVGETYTQNTGETTILSKDKNELKVQIVGGRVVIVQLDR
ncbi:hypothetical protein CAPTEDRAFT_226737 [Capitella teleta]|uniref:Uncharacterized protein n=1 Tax=Capitella teleta TaxID=283909 RepID=N1PB64_CAPTE|nr:hypothetical protein CAPTEDRAFT_226737 [Capitella teleta]|eukprot:ELU18811.1 hypothetical protein CAPTEDRAFT_226737 [Capitella teleta]